MLTTEQLFAIWETEFEFPSTRREDDPGYVSPEKNKFREIEVFKVIVAGSRFYNDYEYLQFRLDMLLNGKLYVEIVSGSCDRGIHTFTRDDGTKVYGADGLGERYAKEKNFAVKLFPANWNEHGKAAGPIRNEAMAKHSHACVVFWDGKSAGSRDMVKKAKLYKLILKEEIINS